MKIRSVVDWASWWLRQLRIHLQCGRPGFAPWIRKIPWREKWQPTPVLLAGELHEERSLKVYSPWGGEESDTTKATFSFRDYRIVTTIGFCLGPIL